MNVLMLFFIGLIAGIVVSRIQKSTLQEPVSDIALGMMGALLLGSLVSQFISLNEVLIIAGAVGAVLFIEMGRALPEPH